ncbi:aspartate aminotransferase family protein [Bacillus cereus]|uniref:aminotransferase family protein n=1 Tax=Bacillus cereus TaxID=1396 RepID=UPI00156ADC98|nr:aminotransferase class III-fold pyridoxal phosphate-dependent enzyme [Bacillus cereus]NRS81942.1 aspartate aminotransferase family protein [Bacillus cereus]
MNYFELDKEYVWHPWTSTYQIESNNTIMQKGNGCYITDINGKTYLDAKSAVLNASCGYNHPKIISAIQSQLTELMNFDHAEFSTIPPILLAEKLSSILPKQLERTFFCTSGSEATETAIKMARMYFQIDGRKQKNKIISLDKGYHGITLGALGASNIPLARNEVYLMNEGYESIPTPICEKCCAFLPHDICEHPSGRELETKILELGPENVAAFIMEPVLGLGGIVIPSIDYMQEIQKICLKYEVKLILDETMTCMGRTGKMFAFEHFNIVPDILICGKGISGGYFPISTITTSQEIYYKFCEDPFLNGFRHGHTNSGHATAAAAALATIQVIEEENLVTNSKNMGKYLSEKIFALTEKYDFIRNVRGLGLLLALDIDNTLNDSDLISKYCFEKGLIIRQMGSTLVLLPPLIINSKQVDEIVSILETVFHELSTTQILTY